MELFLEILKILIPGLIVFLTAYFMLKMLLEDKMADKNYSLKEKGLEVGLPMKLQAYERFTMLCERTDIGPLVLRMRSTDMDASSLQLSMLIGINQEFEHNLSQQMYISETLWQILSLARDETIDLIQKSNTNQSVEGFIDEVFQNVRKIGGVTPMQKALSAIRTEVRTIF